MNNGNSKSAISLVSGWDVAIPMDHWLAYRETKIIGVGGGELLMDANEMLGPRAVAWLMARGDD